MSHVDDECGLDDTELHVVDEVSAARQEHRIGTLGDRGDGVGDAGRAVVAERNHWAASRIAATMFGYAAHRQRLPLMRSRISASDSSGVCSRSSVTWLGAPDLTSSSMPTAEQICP